MNLFDLFRRNHSTVCWRDEGGKIRCLGDNCSGICNLDCPIKCHTSAVSLMTQGNHAGAIQLFKTALSIAPDFKDAWVNLATAHGSMGEHLEAYECYKAAYSLDRNYKNAIFGLIISCKNLGRYVEAIDYCNEYAHRVNKAEADRFKHQVEAAKATGKVKAAESDMDISVNILSRAHDIGLITSSEGFHFIPEIMAERRGTCRKILLAILHHSHKTEPSVWLAWCAYAGIGAVSHWKADWDTLHKKGVAETLLEPRGVFAMDEYVMDNIGIPIDTEEGRKLQHDILILATWVCDMFAKEVSGEELMQNILEMAKAMYIFGMTFEMERLGMS